MYSTISMTYKQLYHILDYEQHLSCGGTNGCGICYKKMRKKFKHALFTQIAIQLNLFGLINTFPSWCIVNHEMDPLAFVNSKLDRGGARFAPGRRFAPCYSTRHAERRSADLLDTLKDALHIFNEQSQQTAL